VGPMGGGSLVGRKLGDYQLQALLGAGGMAEVYRALELPLGREVAVKVLPAALAADPNYVARFRTEARRVAQLRHPNIVEVYAFNGGDHGGLLYLVMPVLRESLRDRLDAEGRLSIEESVRIVTEIASGLEVAHGIGLVHRDVKPENILLDQNGQAKLTDFGIAREMPAHRQRTAAQTLAATGLPVGTPEYMAPEQLRGGTVDQRADIYALASVLYELLTGRVPHEAETPYEVAALVLTEPTTPPSERNPDISPELERVVMTALEKIPTQRYPDMRRFAMELNAAARSGKATMRGMAGGWQRKTARIAWNPAVDGAYADVATDSLTAVGAGSGRTRGEVLSRYRWLLLLVASGIILASLCGGGAIMMLNGFPFGGTTPASVSGPTATQTSEAATEVPSTTVSTTATPQPTATSVPTAVPPAVYLTFSPSPLVLVASGHATCTTTQTITNHTAGRLGWAWTSPQLGSAYSFTINGGSSHSWPPADMNPGVAPGASDTLLIKVSSCADKPLSIPITAKDGMGHTYTFDLKIAQ
jgi:eukaryotic-like serine/threonine-protein kinase